MKKRRVLSLWKTIILVFVGIVGVAGVTVLSLCLMGKFNNDHIEPQDMSFVQELDEGMGYYNAQLGQYEVSTDFKMTISTATENVTETRVELSLKNGQAKDGFISDGIIKVPQEVNLNKAFSVTLLSEYNSSIFEDWIVGGTSLLTAKSSNVLLPTQTVKIAVDVPVNDISVNIADSNQTGKLQEVVVGTAFSLDTVFVPENSRYMFSDETRIKNVFYAFTSSYISYNWEIGRFVANLYSGSNFDTVTVYTFASSYYQKQILDLYSSVTNPELLTSNVLRYFEQHPEACVSKSIDIKVKDVDVENFEVENHSKTYNTYLDQYFTLTASSNNGDASLNLIIEDYYGTPLNSLFGNVGIKIPKGVEGFTIEGGKVMEVVTLQGVTTITRKDYNKNFDYAGAPEGTEYYVLANPSPKDYGDYYWQMCATVANQLTLKVNFFFENEQGQWQTQFDLSGDTNLESWIKLVADVHDDEVDPAWKTNDTIKLTINFDEEGNPDSSEIDLSKELNVIEANNVYQTVKYFLFIDTSEVDYAQNINMQEVFACGTGKLYKTDYRGNTLSIPNATAPADGYMFYELDGSVLSAVKSFAGKVKVVAATIKTYANSKPYTTDDGKYLIVKTSRVKDILVESTISIANLDPTFTFAAGVVPNADHNNEYYIPAVNRNESGEAKTMINLQIVLNNSEDIEGDQQKIIDAYNAGCSAITNVDSLRIACIDRNGYVSNDYVTWQGLTVKESSNKTITFEGTLVIEEGYFSAGKNNVDQGTYIALQLQYNDGKETHTKTFKHETDESVDHFYIYYQQPVEMEAEYKSQADLDKNGDKIVDDIEVNISATTGIEITWGNRKIAGETAAEILQNLNNLLTFKLIDQFGNEIEEGSQIYKIRFVETPEEEDDNILSFASTLSQIQNFVSTQGETKTTRLTAYVVDKEENYVGRVDEEGNIIYETNDDGERTLSLMKSETLTFIVSSEGITNVKYDTTDVLHVEPVYADNADLSSVRVSKYVTNDDVIDMNTLLQIYMSGEDTPTGNVMFSLDNTYVSGLSDTNKTDIMKMIRFNSETAKGEEGAVDSILNYTNTEIKTITIINPFKEDTQIVFSATDTSNSLYKITLILTLKADIEIQNSFNLYYQKNSQYLVQNENEIGVFAGERYELTDYLPLVTKKTESQYSWAKSLGTLSFDALKSSESGVFHSSQDFAKLSVESIGDETKVYLVIDDIYQFKSVKITLYYGAHSNYACSTTITLYVNPNIVVRQIVEDAGDIPFVNIENVQTGSAKLSTSYRIYKLTSYIAKGTFDEEDRVYSNDTTVVFAFTNVSREKYVSLVQDNQDYSYTFVNNSSLSLDLGSKVGQEFQIVAQKVGGDSSQVLDAVVIIDGATSDTIVLCENTSSLKISINLGFGGENAKQMAASILQKSDETPVDVINYDGDVYLLLTTATTPSEYTTNNNFKIKDGSVQGDMRRKDENTLATYNISGFVSLSGNSFEAEKTLTDVNTNSLKVVVYLKTIISKVGEKFVYYQTSQSTPENVEDMIFNTYGDTPLDIILGDYTLLEASNVYQSLDAGQSYTIVHDSTTLTQEGFDVSNAYGFYYDSNSTNISKDTASYNLSIVEGAEGYVSGLATLEKVNGDNLYSVLKINHLESAYTDAYIVLKFELYEYTASANYVWYYRIKVNPNFTKTNVTYPYNEVGEYLDVYSPYYQDGEYQIDFSAEYLPQTSKYFDGLDLMQVRNIMQPSVPNRFGNLTWVDEENIQTTTAMYTIKRASVNGENVEFFDDYFEYSFEGNNFIIALLNGTTKLTVVVEKSYLVDGVKMIGSEQEYIFLFNQASNYVVTVKQNGDQLVANADNKFKFGATVSAGSTETVFETDIKISSNYTESDVSDYRAYLSIDPVKGTEEIAQAFKFKIVLPAGTSIYKDENGQELDQTIEEENDRISQWMNIEELESLVNFETDTDYVELKGEDPNPNLYVNKNDIRIVYGYMDENNNLHIQTRESLEQDLTFEIGFYTEEKVVFTIDLTVTSYYNWDINTGTTFNGGQKYVTLITEETKDTATGIFNKLEIDKYILTADTELVEGKTYYALADGVFASVESPTVEEISTYYEVKDTLEDKEIQDVEISLSNGDEVYEYALTTDTELVEGKTYYTFADGTYKAVETPEVENISTYYESKLTLADLVMMIEGSTWQNDAIEFAHLTKDVVFKFDTTITANDNTTYSFSFEMKVLKSFDTSTTRQVSDSIIRYGGLTYKRDVNYVMDQLTDKMPCLENGNTSYDFVGPNGEQGVTEISITPENVGENTTINTTYEMRCLFNGTEVLSFTIAYRYVVYPNVKLTPNYPSPDGSTKLTTEYISTTQNSSGKYTTEVYNEFFASVAPFGIKERIVVEDLAKDTENNPVTSEKVWSVSVASIDNAVVYATGAISETAEVSKLLVSNLEDISNLNLRFEIVNSESNGTVVFDVTVNNVTTTYSVVLVAGSIVKVSTNTPNYSNNRELVYAEDLAKQSENKLFAQNRILNYALNSSVVTGSTYYLRYMNDNNEVQIITITARDLGITVNQDLGKSYDGYVYKGTYISKDAAEKSIEVDKIEDSSIYLTAPKLTARIVAYYYDNTPILLNEATILNLTEDIYVETEDSAYNANKEYYYSDEYIEIADETEFGAIKENGNYKIFEKTIQTTNAKDFALNGQDYEKERKLFVEIKLGDKTIKTAGIYNLYMDIEFTVTGNADSATDYTTVNVNAGVERGLLSYSSFGIKNARTGLNYDQTSMYNSAGTFTLQIYGFTSLKTGVDGDELSLVAGEIHKNLISTEVNGIIYYTGLTPRVNSEKEINEIDEKDGDLKNNYITLSGVLNNGKTVDYNIYAQGANNDGNHVMMKITYMVDLGDGNPITKSHNILFKVLPNSTVRFKARQEDSQIYNGSSTEINNNQTYVSNKDAAYGITFGSSSTSQTFNLWNNAMNSNFGASTIIANMYGTSTNSANQFTYKYTNNIALGYNDYSDNLSKILNEEKSGAAWKWDSEDTITYRPDADTTNLSITSDSLTLGTRYYKVLAENKFGYKIWFYFTVTADVNPLIYSMSNSILTEKTDIAVGLRYKTVAPTSDNHGEIYEAFPYKKVGDEFADKIKITAQNYEKNYTLKSISLNATTTAGRIYTKIVKPNMAADTKDYTQTINIWGEATDWTQVIAEGEEEDGLDGQTDLLGAEIVLTLDWARTSTYREDGQDLENTKPIGTYKAEYMSDDTVVETLNQIHAVSSDYTNPTFNGVADDATQVILSGISANAYSNNLGAVDFSSAQKASAVSRANMIFVKQIEFFLGDESLGVSASETNLYKYMKETYTSMKDDAIEEFIKELFPTVSGSEVKNVNIIAPHPLITDSAYSFVQSDEKGGYTASRGKDYKEGMEFKVPVVSGIHYGTRNTISNVRMNITLVDVDINIENDEVEYFTSNECVLTEYVTLKRAADTEELFESNVLTDDSSPEKNDNTTGTLYNDTLEVELDAGESLTFAINDTEIKEITEDGKMYVVTADTDFVEDKTYYTYDNEGKEYNAVDIREVESPSGCYEIKNAKLITLTNNKDYTVVEYVGISANIVDLKENLKSGDTVYIQIVSPDSSTKTRKDGSKNEPIIKYANREDNICEFSVKKAEGDGTETKDITSAEFEIVEYGTGMLTQRIESIYELNSANYKTENLYFLYEYNGQVYQHVESFDIYPQFEKAQKDDNYFQVDDYYKMSNSTNQYYIIRLKNWASAITLYGYNHTTGSADQLTTNTHRFYFEIPVGEDGAGSAFVDENGMITTTEDFDIRTHTITVNVYMKVAGADGYFETANKKLLLGTFRLYLNANATINMQVTDEPASDSSNTDNSGDTTKYWYQNLIVLNNNVISRPDGYSLYANETLEDSSIENGGALEETKVVEVGKEFNFKEHYDQVVMEEDQNNLNWHFVGYKLNDGAYTPVYFNNLNSWTFTQVGTYECDFILHGRDEDGDFVYHKTSTIIVYETSTKEEQQVAVKYTVTEDFKTGYNWYEINENGTVKDVTNYSPEGIGIFTKTYLVEDTTNKTTKLVTKYYYVYDNEVEASVTIRPSTTFNLANLVTLQTGQTVEFYKVGKDEVTLTKKSTDSFALAENNTQKANYVVCIKNADGIVSMSYYTVEYHIVSATVNELSTFVASEASEGLIGAAEAKIREDLGLKTTDSIKIDQIGENGILTEAENVEDFKDDDGKQIYVITQTYLVTYNSKYYRYKITFYVYNSELTIDYTTTANNALSLSSLNQTVLEKVGQETAEITYYQFKDNVLEKRDTISIEEELTETFYVKVGNDYYNITVNFILETLEETSPEVNP